jgi:hypothetical protein
LERLGEVQRLRGRWLRRRVSFLRGGQMVAAGRSPPPIAHDIKGPLQLIKNMVYLARRDREMVEFLDKIVGAVDHANNMIEGREAGDEGGAARVWRPPTCRAFVTEGASVAEGAAEVKLRLEVEPLGLQIVDAVEDAPRRREPHTEPIDAMPSGGASSQSPPNSTEAPSSSR